MGTDIKPKLFDTSKLSRKALIGGTLIFSTIIMIAVLASAEPASTKNTMQTLTSEEWGLLPGETSAQAGTITNGIGEKVAEVTFLDVGQGNCSICRLPGGVTIMVDAGSADTVSTTIEYLDAAGIKTIKDLIISSASKEHFGGAQKLVESGRVETIYLPNIPADQINDADAYNELLKAIADNDVKLLSPNQGDIIYSDAEQGVSFTVLSPVQKWKDLSNYSLVTRLIMGSVSFLFTGDAGEPLEQALHDTKQEVTSNVILIGNHGADSGTSIDFIDAVNPDYAVISVKGDPSGDNPSEDILNRLLAREISIYRTDLNKAITFNTDGKGIQVTDTKEGA